MKFYDLEWLAEKCGTDNKEAAFDKTNPANERYISNVLLEIEENRSPITAEASKNAEESKAVNE